MKALPATLTTKLLSGVTTLCHCWRVARRDGTVLGFTDHDADLSFGGVTYRAATGFSGSGFAQRLGLAVDTVDAHGALSSATLTETDLARGLWDNAAVELYRVDWSDVADRVLIFSGFIGEVERNPLAFRAELRSLGSLLNQPEGRTFGTLCDADLGDARCGVAIAVSAFTATATVASVIAQAAAFRTSGLGGYAKDWFKRGRLTWTGGANAGAAMEVKRHTILGAVAVIELAEDMPFDIAVADAFSISAGCDKSAATCFSKFNNIVNHRGFPMMPGNDWITSYPNRGDGNDGGSLSGPG